MNFKIEVPIETLIISRKDLKGVVTEMMEEMRSEIIDEEILTIKETAAYLKVSIPTVRNLIVNKEIPYFQRGQVIRLNRKDVNIWMRNSIINKNELSK
ncbi:helix-turn-helix domain-containing protein [Bacillus sp. RG28]|uniref:Helix-turn-helix domain-containing protein n=1 Tax=Gottfriedia endophytica TaxID=2820819 RepID=A0A940NR66_9BACI|nr:helix-turn-helix domain-containing protein [Gottfriedia endophytica]MBP0726779.1 helix-turn-helix domain-containing protein [Gottfriedia endophytica]